MLCYLEETDEALAGILRPGNATANATDDNIKVLERGAAPAAGIQAQARDIGPRG